MNIVIDCVSRHYVLKYINQEMRDRHFAYLNEMKKMGKPAILDFGTFIIDATNSPYIYKSNTLYIHESVASTNFDIFEDIKK